MKRHALLSLLCGLTAVQGCTAFPPLGAGPAASTSNEAASLAAAPAGVIHLGVQGRPGDRRVQAFSRQVAYYDVTLTRLEDDTTIPYEHAEPGEDGVLSLTCNNLLEGRYTISVAAYDAAGQCLNASGLADTFYPEGLELRAWQALGSQDAPIVCAVALRASAAGIVGSAIDGAFNLQDGALTPYVSNQPVQTPEPSDTTGVELFTGAQVAASVDRVFTAWRETEDGGAYMGPATLTSTTTDPDNEGTLTLVWTITDTTVTPATTRTVKFYCYGTLQRPRLTGVADLGVQPLQHHWLSLTETQRLSFKRTADPDGVATDRHRLVTDAPQPATYDLFMGRPLEDNRRAVLGLTMTLPSPDGSGPSTVIHLERLSR